VDLRTFEKPLWAGLALDLQMIPQPVLTLCFLASPRLLAWWLDLRLLAWWLDLRWLAWWLDLRLLAWGRDTRLLAFPPL
jgi:hypothetical protein